MARTSLLQPVARWAVPTLAIALGYALLGIGSMAMRIAPRFALPLFPAAGLALACALVLGRRAVPGIALGGAAIVLWTASVLGADGHPLVVLLLTATVGAPIQALVGAAAVRRLCTQPLTLSAPADIARFCLLAVPLSCLCNPLLWAAGELALGVPADTPRWLTGLSWWGGDTLGALVAAPITLTLIGRPRLEWAPRRWSVGLTMASVALLLAVMIHQMVRWNEERDRMLFERDAVAATATLAAALQGPLDALEALRGVYAVSDQVGIDALQRWAAPWFAMQPGLQAIGHSAWPDDAVIDAADAPLQLVARPQHTAEIARWFAAAPPEQRQAIVQAGRVDAPVAALAGGTVTLYRRVDTPLPNGANGANAAATRGLLLLRLQLDGVLATALQRQAGRLLVCLVDVNVNGSASVPQRVAGAAGCERRGVAVREHLQALDYAGRHWQVRISATDDTGPLASVDAWLFSVGGGSAAALLCALLLAVTGRTRRIEAAVSERTAALEHQNRERALAENALRASEQRFRNIFQHIPIGVVYTDLRGQVQETNARYCDLLGYDTGELLSMNVQAFTHPDDVEEDRRLAGRLVRGDFPSYGRQKRYIARGGDVVWVQTTVSLLRDESGRPQRLVGAVEDITERMRLEEAESAREAAEISSRAKSDFLSRMSHELRTPLNAMLGFAQLLEVDQRHPLSDAHRPWVAQIQEAGWHLLEMINDVLDLSRIDSGNLRLTPETLRLSRLLAATLPLVERSASARGIILSQDIAPQADQVFGDATRVKQILTNLLTNAVKYNIEGGRIHVATRPDGAMLELAVTDTGLGMSQEQLAELFQPFNRLGRERTTSQEGTGIGLVISRRLAELMGGELLARSSDGEGSSFILRLPRIAEAPETGRSGYGELDEHAAEYHRRLVHYVEDNETNVEVMRGILAQRPQVELSVSITGLDGLAAIRARRPDVILLDMHLPDISGMDLLHHLKDDPATASIPVVIVSADALATQIDAALSMGAERYLTKPVNVTRTLQTIDALLDPMETRYE